jgi:hypothetical protein
MSGYIPPAIERELRKVRDRVESGEFSLEQAGINLTHLNFHPDIDNLTDPDVREVIEDIGPNLEVESDRHYACQYWHEIKELLSKVFHEHKE